MPRPHVVFASEPHRHDLAHFRDRGALVPSHVLSVDRDAGIVVLSPRAYGILATTCTYTVDPEERMAW